MSGDHNMRGEDNDEISTSTHFLPKPKTYGCDPNEFNPDWDAMAVMVEHSQEQAAKIEQLEKQLAVQTYAADNYRRLLYEGDHAYAELKEATDKWKTNYANAMDVNANLRAKIAERSAEHLAAHITYDKGYQAGRDDTKDAEDAFNRGIEAAQQRLMQMHRIASERHNLYGHAALELAKLKEME